MPVLLAVLCSESGHGVSFPNTKQQSTHCYWLVGTTHAVNRHHLEAYSQACLKCFPNTSCMTVLCGSDSLGVYGFACLSGLKELATVVCKRQVMQDKFIFEEFRNHLHNFEEIYLYNLDRSASVQLQWDCFCLIFVTFKLQVHRDFLRIIIEATECLHPPETGLRGFCT